MLRFFNTMTRKKEAFHPAHGKEVRMYSCGPTVYDYAHIGNFRSYIFSDLLRRYLEYKDFRVKLVMNLTDVDDKTIMNSRKQGVSLGGYTEKYKKAFFDDIKKLNIKPASVYPAATEHIKEMVTIVKSLLERGYAYRSDDGSVYFDISKFRDYGKLAKLDIKGLKAGARVSQDEYEKDQAQDFALWKAWTPEDGDVFWETELGKGRPGWHIECSAMSTKYLGSDIDIHTGGVDLIFPHHENEIAQYEAATGKHFVRFWMHNEHLLVENKKMSKSLGNFYTLRDLLDKGYSPKAIRYILLATHYRQKLNFTLKGLDAAAASVRRMLDFMDMLETPEGEESAGIRKIAEKAKKGFEKAMDDDLNIAEALAAVFSLIREVNTLSEKGKLGKKGAAEIKKLMLDFDRVLGVLERKKKDIGKDVEKLIAEREEARKAKDWARADAIRDKLKAMGVILEDSPSGVRWKIRK
ncbi:MAG: cysteine--tRNA ligase [Candidatus Aenigmarchaeota archaeon]|nr:cysteine--tRNA ligase [Candidatus Aenigmarchaeota archaeon]